MPRVLFSGPIIGFRFIRFRSYVTYFVHLMVSVFFSTGTTRRINNWDQMSEHERQVTWKRISKRNEERRRRLLEQQQQSEDKKK